MQHFVQPARPRWLHHHVTVTVPVTVTGRVTVTMTATVTVTVAVTVVVTAPSAWQHRLTKCSPLKERATNRGSRAGCPSFRLQSAASPLRTKLSGTNPWHNLQTPVQQSALIGGLMKPAWHLPYHTCATDVTIASAGSRIGWPPQVVGHLGKGTEQAVLPFGATVNLGQGVHEVTPLTSVP
jgi:hypothetical protein